MRNPALLAAELTGRPLLMLESSVLPYAQMLGVVATGERRSALSAFIGGARRLFRAEASADRDGDAVSEPLVALPRWMGEPEHVGFGWALKDGVAVIEVAGPLMEEGFGWGDCWYHGYDTLLMAFEEMAADANVRAVFGRIRCNGGIAAAGLPQLAKFLRENRAKAGGKPIWFFCDRAYSAAYWLVSQGDHVVAARESGVGSIGAVISHCEMSKGLSADGITVTKFKFGLKKTDGSWDEPLSETANTDLTADVQQCGRWFVADVLKGRENLTEEVVIGTQAGCFYGDSDDPAYSALKLGLIDAVMTEREAFEALKASLATPISPAPPAKAPGALSPAKETDVKRSEVLAGLKKAGLNQDQIKAAMAQMPEDGEDAAPEGEDQADDAEVEDEAEAEGGENEPAAKVNAKVAQAVLDLPEARGREKLAKKLAFQPGMTVGAAKELLASAGKETGLSDRVRDPNLAPSGGTLDAALTKRLDPEAIYRRRKASASRAA